MPAHYLKQFHQTYADKDELAKAVKAAKVSGWVALHERKSRQYRPENPDLPTLDPWRNTTSPPAEQFRFERNPYFHRVDTAGHQLPYFDAVTLTLGTPTLIPAKTAAGEADLQARYLNFEDYTFLKAGEASHGYEARLWEDGIGAFAALFPNLNARDPVWRALNRDVRFRRGAVARHQPARHQPRHLLRAGARERRYGAAAEPALHEGPGRRLHRTTTSPRPMPCSTRQAWPSATPTARGCCPTGAAPRSRSRPRARTSSTPTSWSSSASDWAKLGIRTFVHPVPPRHLPPAHRERRHRDVDGPRHGQCGADGGIRAQRPRTDPGLAIPVAGFRALRAVVRARRPEDRRARGQPPPRPLARLAPRRQGFDPARRLEGDAARSTPTRCSPSASSTARASPSWSRGACSNVPETGLWSFQPSSYFGLYMPDTFFYADAGKG